MSGDSDDLDEVMTALEELYETMAEGFRSCMEALGSSVPSDFLEPAATRFKQNVRLYRLEKWVTKLEKERGLSGS